MATNDSTPHDSRSGGGSDDTAVLRPEDGRHRAEDSARTQQLPPARSGATPGTAPAAAAVPAQGAHVTRGTARDTLAAQRDRFGGIKWGAAFFGWLSANGLAVLLIALLSAAGVGLGLAKGVTDPGAVANRAVDQVKTVGIAGAVTVVVVLFLAYLAGGYVAGRMARFDGARQGLAVWLIGLLVVLLLALAGSVLGAQYNVLKNLNLPRIPIAEGTATTAGILTLAAILVGTLLGAVLGGGLGTRYHRRIDRVAVEG